MKHIGFLCAARKDLVAAGHANLRAGSNRPRYNLIFAAMLSKVIWKTVLRPLSVVDHAEVPWTYSEVP